MYRYILAEMTEAICKELGLVAKSNTERVHKTLEAYWADKIAIVWTVEDVRTQAKEAEHELTEDQCKQVLWRVQHRQDANIGVNWDTIGNAIKEVLKEDESAPTQDQTQG